MNPFYLLKKSISADTAVIYVFLNKYDKTMDAYTNPSIHLDDIWPVMY